MDNNIPKAVMNHTILIVDDDKLILNTLKQRFETWNCEVYAVGTSEEAKQVLQTLTPEVDYLKSQDRLQNAPVIILTNLDKPELKQMLLAQGVKEYWIKGSMSMDELYQKVMGYLEPGK